MIVLSGLALTVQLYGLYRPIGPLEPTWFPQADKIGHLLVFAMPVALILLTLTWYAARRSATVSPRAIAVVVGAFAGHAALSEVIQDRLYVSRVGDPWDLLADGLGIALGLMIFVALGPGLARSARTGGALPARAVARR